MIKVNTKKVFDKYGACHIFVTRGRSKPFTDEEVGQYFALSESKLAGFTPAALVEAEVLVKKAIEELPEPLWTIPNDRPRKVMFLRDLKSGIAFCVGKYGVTEEDVIREARRIAPHMNLGVVR